MAKFNLSSKGYTTEFSSKSLTIDGKEYLYTKISAIKHLSAKHVYLFKYEGKLHPVYYDKKDAQKASALFAKIAILSAKSAEAQAEAHPQKTIAEEMAEYEASQVAHQDSGDTETVNETVLEKTANETGFLVESSKPDKSSVYAADSDDDFGDIDADDTLDIDKSSDSAKTVKEPITKEAILTADVIDADIISDEIVVDESPLNIDETGITTTDKDEALEVIETLDESNDNLEESEEAVEGIDELDDEDIEEIVEPEDLDSEPLLSEEDVAELTVELLEEASEADDLLAEDDFSDSKISAIAKAATTDTEYVDSDKATIPTDTHKETLKKSLTTFAIIIAAFLVAGIIYFFAFGPSNNAAQTPNTNPTQQYNDIEDLIDQMQE